MSNKNFCVSYAPEGFVPPHILSQMPEDTPILVAFSGGPDSRALLDLVCRYSKVSGCRVYAAHLNHGIRGAEADRDEQFCIRAAEKYGIKIFVRHADIPSLSRENGKSVELCARDERYAFFAEIMKKQTIPLLATAHNANDNIETMLFNLSRGSGLSGLSGIPPARECEGGLLIRPILNMSRCEILSYCEKNQLDYVIDSTNTDTDYTRNKIRAEVIPVLKQINGSLEKKAADASMLLRRDEELLSSLADEFIQKCLTPDGAIPLDMLKKEHLSVTSRALLKIYSKKFGSSLEQIHVDDILTLASKGVAHSRISLPAGTYALIENSSLYLLAQSELLLNEKSSFEPYEIEVDRSDIHISPTNAEIIIGRSQREINIYKKSIQFTVDSAKINGGLILRSKADGDRILMGGMHKSVKKLMCDRKIPIEDRARLPILCDSDGIVAIPFIGVCDRVDPKKNKQNDSKNKKLIEIQFYLY